MEFSKVIAFILFEVCVMPTLAQLEDATPSQVWKAIEKEAESIVAKRDMGLVWEAAKRIAKQSDRFSIATIYKNLREVSSDDPSDQYFGATYWNRILGICVIIELVDPQGQYGLKPFASSPGLLAYNHFPAMRHTVPMVAMDTFHDDASREWLFEMAVTGDKTPIGIGEFRLPGYSYIALQLLRGHEPTAAMRAKLENTIDDSPTIAKQTRTISHREAVRSVLASWDYAASLNDAAIRHRYREFQSQMWRFYAMGGSVTRETITEFDVSVSRLLDQWQPGDERFVLHIFEESSSTPDEMEIALRLAHKLPDISPLRAIAESNSPQSPYARKALEWIARQPERGKETPPVRSGK
jgi:hypothetical protein